MITDAHYSKESQPIIMGEYGLVTVAEVQAPDLDVAICRTRHKESAVAGYIHTQNGKLVAVQREKKLKTKRSSPK